jgi:hypothetical protein
MSKIAALLAVLMFAFATTASARVGQDFRSPDARPAVVPAQDFRSPDARPAVVPAQDYRSPDARPTAAPSVSVQDLRSPDARPSGQFAPMPATHPVTTSTNSFDWGYLAIAIGIALSGLAVLLVTQRRRRHGLAIGS